VTVVAGFADVRLDLDRAVVGSAATTGRTVFSLWVLPFEVLSELLLAALVGSIVLSRLGGED
jgi:NADH-quinone oxidoreductase subunit J